MGLEPELEELIASTCVIWLIAERRLTFTKMSSLDKENIRRSVIELKYTTNAPSKILKAAELMKLKKTSYSKYVHAFQRMGEGRNVSTP